MKLRSMLTAAVLAIAFMAVFSPSQAQAASQDECAIWLCAPGGFPSGCGNAYDAMIDRVEDLKPPLPPFSACATNPPRGQGHMTADQGVAAYIPPQRVCKRRTEKPDRCVWWETEPARYIRGTSCYRPPNDDLQARPAGCTRTVRYIRVFSDGEQVGPEYRW